MKAFLLSASALALTACAATSADEPHQARTDHRVHVMHTGDMHHGRHARVVEVVGDHGERTVHVVSGDGTSEISVNGRRIEVVDGAVIVDGERHDFDGGRIVIDGDDIHVSEGFGPHRAFAWHMGPDSGEVRIEVARAMEEVERAMAEIDSIDWVARDEALEEAFAEIENIEIDIDDPDEDTWIHRDGERVRFGDLSPAEQEEIREELAEARIAARDALRSARIEMRSARDEGRNARIEVRRARDEARRARDEARGLRDQMRWHFRDMGDASEIRIEDENGNTRVWLDERELEGAELEEFLDRMEEHNERFAEMRFGQMQFDGEPRVFVFTDEDGSETEVVRSRRVVVEIDNDGDRRVIEIEPGDEPALEGDD
ncbi:hypothetical protein L5876_12130 [Hyphobacterium sp. SN044]|uniref:hypothetical protein n=1 Tax=Hyphobacterium sp. SN044 TaxID=2912575 RepID=UPI001F23075F|nr:hypothetical protein [Hyphobacterium sp. SN044]MCF8880565.1 hypothetical protein [Hyphobacterium sp. SN044]